MTTCIKDANICNCEKCKELMWDLQNQISELYTTDLEEHQCIDPNCNEYRIPGDTLCVTHFNKMLVDIEKEHLEQLKLDRLISITGNVIEVDFSRN